MELICQIELQEKQSYLFKYAFNKGIDIFKFIDCFMKSDLAKELDRDFSNVQLQPINMWYEEIVNTYNIKKINHNVDIEAILFLGYFYRKWHFITGEPSYKIIRYLPSIEGVEQYYNLHQLKESDAIIRVKTLYNKRKNKHRKYENKQFKIDNTFYLNNSKFFAFLAKKILYKLYSDKCFTKMKYKEEGDLNIFYNEEDSICLNVISIRRNNKIKLIEEFKKYTPLPSYKKTILFIFVLSKSSQIEINKIRDINKFSEVYIYNLGKIYYINESKEINTYDFPISYKIRECVNKEIRLDSLYEEINSYIESVNKNN